MKGCDANLKTPVSTTRYLWICWVVLLFPVLWAAMLAAQSYIPNQDIAQLLANLNACLNNPFHIQWTLQSPRYMLLFGILYIAGIGIYYSTRKKTRLGEEHGCSTMIKTVGLRQGKFDRIFYLLFAKRGD
jgi:hypothetical protein